MSDAVQDLFGLGPPADAGQYLVYVYRVGAYVPAGGSYGETFWRHFARREDAEQRL